MELTPGMMIAGRYRVDHRVGTGGMGEVWAGEHVAVGTRVALKTLLPAAACDHEIVARFKREAYFLGRIRSDHVARVVDFVADDAVGLVLVMEFIEGTPLSLILQSRSLTVEETIDLGIDIVSALCDLHRSKIIHRDLKPGNIIMKPMPDGSARAIVVDFGVSRAAPSGADDDELTGITRVDMAVGTMEYMAPEQILNSRDVTAASDLYAVGALLYRAVAGRHLFGEIYDADLAKRKLTVDPPPLKTGRTDRAALGLEQVVNRVLQRRPKMRYATAELMLSDLTALRDISRALALDLEATTQDSRGSISGLLHADGHPSTEVLSFRDNSTEPQGMAARASRVSQASGEPAPPSFPFQPGPHAEHGTPLPAASTPSSITGAEASIPEPQPRRRRSVPLAAALALTAVALAGGAGLGSTWTQRKLNAMVEQVTATTAPPPERDPAATPPSAASAPTAAPLESAAAAPQASGSAAPAAERGAPVASAPSAAPAQPSAAPLAVRPALSAFAASPTTGMFPVVPPRASAKPETTPPPVMASVVVPATVTSRAASSTPASISSQSPATAPKPEPEAADPTSTMD